jgi:ketol-acid reductoisomerase
VTDETRKAMKQILTDIQTGKYAEGWIAENANGRPWFTRQRQQEQHLLIEKVGEQLRAMMPFLKPVKIQTEEPISK